MKILSEREEMIFRKDYNDKAIYSIGLSKKKQDGTWQKGYLAVNFKKGVDLKNQTKIKIKDAWLDFYNKDKATIPILFINDFEIIEQLPVEQLTTKTDFDLGEQIQIQPEDLPF
jgi:hypothetical protein